ncbi:HD domain-containing protein [Candidatus Gracilibacteria bacterium]|nr:MAG: HD domain-containing protein [Candidatus Gracilibacteria bacterium]
MEKNILGNAKKYVNLLLSPLNKHYYHSYEHAIDVMQRAIYLSEQENLSVDEIEMMALAGLFHDTGFIVMYDKNEPIGAKIASNYLKSINYDKNKIKLIEQIILATDPDYTNPKNIYEKIIKDADMDNLGRDDFQKKSNDIKKELETVKKIKIKDPEWHHSLVDLLISHKFNTDVQRKERDKKKQENLNKMITKLKKEYKK